MQAWQLGQARQKGCAMHDVVEVPQCGFWTVVWSADHPDRGRESGTMLVPREQPESTARDMVCEILWGRGFTGDYKVAVQ